MTVLKQPMLKCMSLLQEIVVLYAAMNGYFDSFGTKIADIFVYKKLISTVLTHEASAFFNVGTLRDIVYDAGDNYTYKMFQIEADKFLTSIKRLMASTPSVMSI